MRHVAKVAGVGIKTVSRVMNDEPDVSEATRQRVLDASLRLNYQLDMVAGSLRRPGRQTLSIGLLLPRVANPFSSRLHRAIENALTPRGIAVFAASMDDDPDREKALVAAFLGRRVDGLVLTPIARSQIHTIPEHSRALPMVFIEREPLGIDADAVVTNNAVAAAHAASHLLAHGHTRLAYLGDRADIQGERRRGFTGELERAGLYTYRIPVREGLHNEESARQAALELLGGNEPPTAFFSSQHFITFGVIRALKELRLSRKVALVGFDDFALADMMDPGVTVIAQHPERIGKVAAERLLARIDGDDRAPETYVVPSELIERGSGELSPAP
ncbi:LacI family DNA-binding transcriptional regulator [Paenarthrobacter sp. YIM B13468]|uniref:LacI family DNA-binding transcriptional regulator n=1 Tax=Paenarthrobacter sp. YIM B13468 TaxID=3366295 RepID=UPI00366C7969